MKIIASLSLESSLHALVNIGSPIGTNTKPGGGSASFVTYEEISCDRVPGDGKVCFEFELLVLLLRIRGEFEV